MSRISIYIVYPIVYQHYQLLLYWLNQTSHVRYNQSPNNTSYANTVSKNQDKDNNDVYDCRINGCHIYLIDFSKYAQIRETEHVSWHTNRQ